MSVDYSVQSPLLRRSSWRSNQLVHQVLIWLPMQVSLQHSYLALAPAFTLTLTIMHFSLQEPLVTWVNKNLARTRPPQPNHFTGVLEKELISQIIEVESQTQDYGGKELFAQYALPKNSSASL